MRHHALKLTLFALGLLGVASGTVSTALASDDDSALAAASEVRFDRTSDQPLLSYVQLVPELAEQDYTPLVRVFGDGRLLVHRPPHYRDSGTWQGRLNPLELERFLARVTPALGEFDAPSVRRVLRGRAPRTSGGDDAEGPRVIYAQADAPVTYIELTVQAYRAAPGSALVQLPVPLSVAYDGLQGDSEHFPDVPALQSLAAVERIVQELADRKDLSPVPGGRP